MKRVLLLLCIFVFAAVFAHELHLDAVEMQQTDLSEITVLSDEEYRSLTRRRIPWLTDALSLSACGQTLPQDETDLYYAPADGGITVKYPKDAHIARTEFQTDELGNTTCRIIRYDGISHSVAELLVTGLPVMDLRLLEIKSERYPIGAGKHLGALILFSENPDGTLRVQTEAVEASERGGSSRKYEKKSHTLFFVDEQGNDRTASLLDFPADTKFALNSLFEDDTKIRDAFSLDLWNALDTATRKPDQKSNAVLMRHIELLINGRYWGIYGLQQTITPHALDLEAEDALYKINSHFSVHADNTLHAYPDEIEQDTPSGNANGILTDAFIVFPNIQDASVPTLNWDNAINYALLIQLSCAADNETRNMAACYRAEKNELYMIGWDLDQTFGSLWTGSSPTFVENNFDIISTDRLAIHEWKIKPFSTLFNECEGFSEALIARYHALREGIISDEALLTRANVMFNHLTDCGARARDAKRWPTSASSTQNFVETFLPLRTAYLDTLYAAAPSVGN